MGKGDKRGFTLLELLVAMVLVSMVTLIVAMALKLSIESWERGCEEGEDVQLWGAIPALMGKQLSSLVKADPFDKAAKTGLLPFCGQEHTLSFFTSYAPQGSPWQGLLRVTYLFKEEEETLYLYEQVITNREDIREGFDPLSNKREKSLVPISQVGGITDFILSYTDQERGDPQDMDTWKKTWECLSTSLPTGLGVRLQAGRSPKAQSRSWYFRPGGIGP
jgi:prepilin-type N-terminal cleavage/methylation domain-containing protein